MTVTPEQREALERRKAELKLRMDELRSRFTTEYIPEEWATLYAEREAIDRQLDAE